MSLNFILANKLHEILLKKLKPIITTILIFTMLISISACLKKENESDQQIDYRKTIKAYLSNRVKQATIIYNWDGRKEFTLVGHNFKCREMKKGIEITVDGQTINTSKAVTTNPVWKESIDSVNFANSLLQIKIYEYDSLIGFVLSRAPCSGLGCGVNYQIIYDLKTKTASYFGRFRTGFEFDLYDFNNDDRIDYLSKTFYGRSPQGIDSTRFVMYSQTGDGHFEKFSTEDQSEYWFQHTYSHLHLDLNNEGFKEQWVVRIVEE
jgi:hypothetical protein